MVDSIWVTIALFTVCYLTLAGLAARWKTVVLVVYLLSFVAIALVSLPWLWLVVLTAVVLGLQAVALTLLFSQVWTFVDSKQGDYRSD